MSFTRIAGDVSNCDQIDHVGIGVLSSAHLFCDICRCNISRVPSRVPTCVATQKGDHNSRMSLGNGRFWPVERVSRAHRKGLTSVK